LIKNLAAGLDGDLDLGQGSGHAASASFLMPYRLVFVPHVGHSMNLELPALYAGYFGAWFGGLAA